MSSYKFFFSFFILLAVPVLSQTGMASFIREPEVPNYNFIVWHSFEIDSAWLNVWLPNGDLPRRANKTYRYWKEDSKGNLIPVRKIEIRLPIFWEESLISNKEKNIFFIETN